MLTSISWWGVALPIIALASVALTGLCRLQARRQRKPLELAYSTKNALMGDFVRQTEISRMEFEPYTFGINPLLQTIVFIVYELINQLIFPEPFEKELFKVSDGGTLGFDWDGGIPDPEETPMKPILLMVPGVAGDSDNMYQIALLRELRKQFKIVTLLFRGTDGVPITSGSLSHCGSWQDIQAGINYVADKYVKDRVTGEKRCRFYVYGCSMGATMLGLYLVNDSEKSGELLDAAVLYGTPWDYNRGWDYFFNGYGGWPSWAVTMNLRRITMTKQLPQLREHLTRERYAYYANAFANCNGYENMVRKIWLPMFGHASIEQFLNDMTINRRLHKVKVPLFAFGAKDDIILNHETIPNEEVRESQQPIMIATSAEGAHCCHLTNGSSIIRPKSWYQVPCAEFLRFMETRLDKVKPPGRVNQSTQSTNLKVKIH